MNNIGIIVLFLMTASVGVALLLHLLKNQKRPMGLVALKFILATASIGVLIFHVSDVIRTRQTVPMEYPLEAYAFVAFSVAAMGGLFMMVRDKLLGQDIPKWFPFIHAAFGVIGFIILIIASVKG